MLDLNKLGKVELRAQCKEHGIKNYGTMNNEQMRMAIFAVTDEKAKDVSLTVKAKKSVTLDAGEVFKGNAVKVDHKPSNKIIADFLAEEAPKVRPLKASELSDLAVANALKARASTNLPPVSSSTPKPAKVAKTRAAISANGAKAPGVGTMCRQIWDVIDSFVAEGKALSLKEVTAVCVGKGLNRATTRTQYARWNEFHKAK